MKAMLLVSHGSRLSKGVDELHKLAERIKTGSGVSIFHLAFSDIGSPSIEDGVKMCVDEGASEIFVLLNFLNSGKHVDEDIPRTLEQARKNFPGIGISISPPIGSHPRISELFLDWISLDPS